MVLKYFMRQIMPYHQQPEYTIEVRKSGIQSHKYIKINNNQKEKHKTL